MGSMVVSERSSFECAYLFSVKGCGDYVLNSHTYKVEVSVSNSESTPYNQLVIEFKSLKHLLNKSLPNGYFLYNVQDSNTKLIARDFASLGIPTLNFNCSVSAESLAKYILDTLQESLYELYPTVVINELKLREGIDSLIVCKPDVN